MAEIETLTDEERAALAWPMPHRAEGKALRIIDAQAARIAELEQLLREVQYQHSRAMIELSLSLETSIVSAIGRHPRDGDG